MKKITKLTPMKNKGFILVIIGIILFTGFIIFSFTVINKPQPLEVQGEVDARYN